MQTNTPLPFATKAGQKLTLIVISDWMAHNMRSEIEITGEQDGKPTFKQRGKRKQYYLKLSNNALVFEGWDLPIRVDSDSNSGFSGNACYNLVMNTPDELKELLAKSLNPVSETTKAEIFFISTEQFNNGDIHNGVLLYPEHDTHHAVINRHKEKIEVSATADFFQNGNLTMLSNAD